MRRRPSGAGRSRPPIQVAAGERVLAWAEAAEGVVAGTRDALYVGSTRVAWERVEAADWDRARSAAGASAAPSTC